MNPLDQYSHAIKNLCGKHKLRRLYAFGSVLANHFSDASDIFAPVGVAAPVLCVARRQEALSAQKHTENNKWREYTDISGTTECDTT